MNAKELFNDFNDNVQAKYEQEARERWGSDYVEQANSRYKEMGKEGIAVWQREYAENLASLAALMDRDAGDPDVQGLIHKFRESVGSFYDCSVTIFRGLGEMYVDDERFRGFFAKVDPKLPEFLREGIRWYCDHRDEGQ